MYLTKEEEAMLSGEKGLGVKKAMEIVVSIGDICEAESLIDVQRVQISGVSYKTIGDAGIEFLRDFSKLNAKVKVLATLNPAGVDPEQDPVMAPDHFLKKQNEILQIYENLGATLSCTCTPYLAGNLPAPDEHIAWAESSAVAYANSVIGARTNRESSITALASAVTGKTPRYGLHLAENRLPTFKVKVATPLTGQSDFSTLGYYVGKHYDGIPLFSGINPNTEEFKALCAGLATGKISMFHVEGRRKSRFDLEVVDFTVSEKKEVEVEMNTCEEPDILCVGCPHCTVDEIRQVVAANPDKEVWVYTARQNKSLFKDRIKNENIKIISDTCMVVQPLEEMGISSLGTNSTKCAYYTRYLSGLDVRFDSLKELLK
jgi:predicted aconitase